MPTVIVKLQKKLKKIIKILLNYIVSLLLFMSLFSLSKTTYNKSLDMYLPLSLIQYIFDFLNTKSNIGNAENAAVAWADGNEYPSSLMAAFMPKACSGLGFWIVNFNKYAIANERNNDSHNWIIKRLFFVFHK